MTRERTTSKDLNILILLVVVLLFISTVLVIVTFAVIFWLYNIPNGDKYGMWHGCAKNESLCSSWYENGPTLFSFPITDAFKTFQGLQVIFLVTLFFTVLTLFTNMQFFPLSFWFYVANCSVMFISNACAIASLLVFVINIYDSKKHILGWCYWLQIGVVGSNLFCLIAVCVHIIRLKPSSKEVSKQSLIKNDSSSLEPKLAMPAEPKMTKFKSMQKNLPVSQTPSINNLTNEETSTPKTPPRRPHFNRVNTGSLQKSSKKPYNQHLRRYAHKHIHSTEEQFQRGYSSEPDFIEYSVERSWVNNHSFDDSSDSNQRTFPVDFESKIESEMLNARLPRLVYYDGFNHFARSDFKKISK